MRSIRKNPSSPPHLDPTATPDLAQRLSDLFNYPNTPNTALIDKKPYQQAYRGTTKILGKTVSLTEVELYKYYYGKCAYCETRGVIEIEHYRPKKGPRETGHYGYYWLCYEWTNLVPACHDCNRIGTGKGEQFPVMGPRCSKPSQIVPGVMDLLMNKASNAYLTSEQPFLLHPERDIVEGYFRFEIAPATKYIEIKGFDSSSRGNETIRICHLHREALTRGRKEVVIQPALDLLQGVLNAFEYIPDQAERENLLFKTFKTLDDNAGDDQRSHTLLRRYIVESPSHFDSLIISQVQNVAAGLIIKAAFTEYRRRHPFS